MIPGSWGGALHGLSAQWGACFCLCLLLCPFVFSLTLCQKINKILKKKFSVTRVWDVATRPERWVGSRSQRALLVISKSLDFFPTGRGKSLKFVMIQRRTWIVLSLRKSLLAAAVERIVVGLERGKDFLRAMREGTGNEDLDRDNGGERGREVDRPKSPQRW